MNDLAQKIYEDYLSETGKLYHLLVEDFKLESGDVDPLQAMELEQKGKELACSIAGWLETRIEQKEKLKMVGVTLEMTVEGCQNLADQKRELLHLLGTGEVSDELNGVVHLMDAVQDQMVDKGYFTERVVFPYMEKDEEEGDTHPHYWDCECEKDYIHNKKQGNYCAMCQTFEDEQPDSRKLEVEKNYKPEKDIAIIKEIS